MPPPDFTVPREREADGDFRTGAAWEGRSKPGRRQVSTARDETGAGGQSVSDQ